MENPTQLSISKKNTGRGSLVMVDNFAIVALDAYPLLVLFTTMGSKVGKWKRLSS